MQGLGAAWRYETAFRQEFILALILVPLALLLGNNALERVLLAGSVLLVLVVELLNSAMETVADAFCSEYHPLIGRAKDIGSAAVLVALVLCAATWLLLLWPRWWP